MILIWLIILQLGAGILSWLLSKRDNRLAAGIALTAVIACLLLTIQLFARFRPSFAGGGQWLMEYRADWIPAFGISFHLALDGLSLAMLLLTFFLGALAVLCSWKEIRQRAGFFYFNLLWTLAGITGVFLAIDLFLFYFFWEVMLIPMFFLIYIWGDTRRRYAAIKFFLFTQAGGLLMLLSILAMVIIHAGQAGRYSFDYADLLNTTLSPGTAKLIMGGYLLAFAIKLPVVPFHNWLPDAHGEAPTAGSLILAGLLLKTGAYGIIRFVITMFPEAAASVSWWAMLAGVIGIIYGAFLAYGQTDLKRLIAYTSVSHMGFVMLGAFSFSEMAMQGVVMQLLTHGISTGALFAIAGMLKERLHTRELGRMGGMWTTMPRMGGIAMLFTMASLGLPMLGNFIAEFFILMGAFQASVPLTVIASTGLVFAALYSLRMVQKVFLGPPSVENITFDLDARELVVLGALSVSIVLLGLFPQPVFDMITNVIRNLNHTYE
ncbi:complex I subunit 4 family protein [Flavihumibacter solisilvae]|uniref:NADH dehydrogenase n=1 Tax=Flavihumibacter solisilvae TaxID=1349421 RepID=A0A0C1LDG2_9BACT|nr:NADH-quinone oxidoreductase subunit M [Flavihumibacter solisilvae]KIC93498.1 NADH dehydrogenase [Flavihumibacter solisilvae]